MMYLLDSDHISLLHRGGLEGQRIWSRMASIPPDQITLCIVTYEEQVRGWMAEIARARSIPQQKPRYEELHRMLDLYCATPIPPFDEAAAVLACPRSNALHVTSARHLFN